MNRSFNPWHLVNTYGAFGSVTRRRYEVIVEGTADEPITDRPTGASTSSRRSPGSRAAAAADRAIPPAPRLADVVHPDLPGLRRRLVRHASSTRLLEADARLTAVAVPLAGDVGLCVLHGDVTGAARVVGAKWLASGCEVAT